MKIFKEVLINSDYKIYKVTIITPEGGWPSVLSVQGRCPTPLWRGTRRTAGCGTPEVDQDPDGARLVGKVGFRTKRRLNPKIVETDIQFFLILSIKKGTVVVFKNYI